MTDNLQDKQIIAPRCKHCRGDDTENVCNPCASLIEQYGFTGFEDSFLNGGK